MHDVVLDENIYIRAMQAECTLDRMDLRAARVISAVQESHRWLLSNEVMTAYRRQFSRNQCKGSLTTQLMTSLDQVLADPRRSLLLDAPAEIEGDYHHKDRHVVAAAACVFGAHLVTIDERLKLALEVAGIPERYGFNVLDLDGAERVLVATP